MRPLRVLLVEDSDGVRRVLATRLRLEVDHVAGVEAYGSAEEIDQAGPADVMVVHARLLRLARQLRPDLPIVVISGGPAPADYVGIWVMKPACLDELLPALVAAVQRQEVL